MVEIQDVRYTLNNIESTLIKDEVISGAIQDAEVDSEFLGSSVPAQLLEKWIKYKAAFLTYLAYVAQTERGLGQGPTPMMKSLLDYLADELKRTETAIKQDQASPSGTTAVPIQRTESIEGSISDEVEEYQAGD